MWNFRVCSEICNCEGEDIEIFSIRECHYDDGNILWTENPVSLGDYDSLEDLKITLEHIKKAIDACENNIFKIPKES